ncbi:LexA family protein [Variovorax saccharolyticus]|uniref:LexA family protein n=1 Tax=Variovorax saccharolyticus TaxID=3053516 RepID=UPI002574DC2A|nr:S24 family peptidase [Variovorax sp. J31P216]MDM0030403.1 S24 family peptidase [Variovorax sp. J31P216]
MNSIPLETQKLATSAFVRQAARALPLISWAQARGANSATDPHLAEYVETWVDCSADCSVNSYALRVQGDSMSAPAGSDSTYPHGSIILVDPDRRSVVSGERVIACITETGELTFRVYRAGGSSCWLEPLNPWFSAFTRDFVILGAVLEGDSSRSRPPAD